MNFLNKLKNDRQDLINSLQENIDSLERIVFEQQSEIEQWKEEANKYQSLWCEAVKDIKTAKSEAIKEFAERLKATDMSDTVGEQYINGEIYGYFYSNAFERKIDNLLKEMVGDE